LLEKTLGGAVWTLLDLLQITSPALVLRTHSIRDIVLWINKQLALPDAWQYELAAMLCLVGCIALPDEIFERAYGGQDLSAEEEETFRSHPEVAARLLANIPRLETVAEMIGKQQTPDRCTMEPAKQGARMLFLALELDRKIYRNTDCRSAVGQLRKTGQFDGRMLQALDHYAPTRAVFETRQLLIRELRPYMVLDEDISAIKTKLLILKEGVMLTPMWIERLGNFARTSGIQERIRVRVPTLSGVRKMFEVPVKDHGRQTMT
jgi:hypothetical protein